MSAMVSISPTPMQRFVDSNGNSLVGGLLFTYQAGTTTPFPTYTDETGDTQNTNPIVLNQRGEASIWLVPAQAYKFVLSPANDTNPPTAPIWTEDGIMANAPVAVGNMLNEAPFVAGAGFTPGTTTQLTLVNNYGTAANLWVDFDGIEQHGFSLSGNTLTFSSPIPVGIQVVYVKGGTSLTVGTPAADSVGDAQLSWGNILTRNVDSVASLAALNPLVYTRAYATGLNTPGDGFSGFYFYSATTPQSQANGSSIVAASGGVGCWVSPMTDLPQVVAQVSLVGQTGAIAQNTLLYQPNLPGLHRVNFFLDVAGTGTAGTFTPIFSFDDGSGLVRTVSGNAAAATPGGYSQGCAICYTSGAPIDYGVLASGVTGAPTYGLRFNVERLSY